MKKLHCLAVAAAMLTMPATAFADGDAVAGAAVFKKCSVCHSATQPVAKVGPSLMGVIGRPVATAPGYNYSPAMKAFGADGKVWDEALLKQFLPSPQFLVKGTRMAFAGLKNDADIDNLIAYLKSTATGQ